MPLVKPKKTAELGDLIATAFEEAAHWTTDPVRRSRLAAISVLRLLVRTGNVDAAKKLARVI
jgi:hypothetical protein